MFAVRDEHARAVGRERDVSEDKDRPKFVDCVDCHRGWKGERNCSAGWTNKRRGPGCFMGVLRADVSARRALAAMEGREP